MLQKFHNLTKGWMAWVLVIGVGLIFLLWGVQGYLGWFGNSSNQQQQLKINQEVIPYFQEEIYQSQFGKDYVFIISLQQFLLNLGLRYPDAEIDREIRSMEQFHEDGVYSEVKFAQYMQNNPAVVSAFRKFMEVQGLWKQGVYALNQVSLANDYLTDLYIKLNGQKRDLGIVRFNYQNYLPQVQVEEAAIQQYYQQHQQDFFSPELVSVDYVRLNKKDLLNKIEISNDAAQKYFAEHQAQYTRPEERRFQVIVVDQKKKDAQERLDKIMQSKHLNFNKLTQYADQDNLFSEHNDLDWVAKNDLPFGLLADGVFNLSNVGEVTAPIAYENKWYIFKLLAVKNAVPKTYAEVATEIQQLLQARQASQEFMELKNKFANKAFEESSIDDLARDLGLKVETTELFPAQGGKTAITQNSNVIAAAFSADVLQSGYNSKVLELDSPDDLVVIHLNKHVEPKAKNLAEVTPQIKTLLAQKQARKLASEQAKKFIQELKAGKSAASLAKEKNLVYLELSQIEPANLDDKSTELHLPRKVLLRAFSLPAPEPGKISVGKVNIAVGDSVVAVVNKVTYPELQQDAQNRANMSKNMQDLQEVRNMLALFVAINSNMKVEGGYDLRD